MQIFSWAGKGSEKNFKKRSLVNFFWVFWSTKASDKWKTFQISTKCRSMKITLRASAIRFLSLVNPILLIWNRLNQRKKWTCSTTFSCAIEVRSHAEANDKSFIQILTRQSHRAFFPCSLMFSFHKQRQVIFNEQLFSFRGRQNKVVKTLLCLLSMHVAIKHCVLAR